MLNVIPAGYRSYLLPFADMHPRKTGHNPLTIHHTINKTSYPQLHHSNPLHQRLQRLPNPKYSGSFFTSQSQSAPLKPHHEIMIVFPPSHQSPAARPADLGSDSGKGRGADGTGWERRTSKRTVCMMAIVWVGLVIGQKGEDVTGSSVMWALCGGSGMVSGGRILGGVT